MKNFYRWTPLLILICLSITAYLLGVHNYLSFTVIKAHRDELLAFVSVRPLLSPLLFAAGYALVVALSIPIAMFLSVLSGFLFVQPFSTIYVVIGATAGATSIFLIARSALGDILKAKAGARLQLLNGFNNHRVSYLLLLRLVPLVPFWVANVAPAFFNVPVGTFVWTTAVGILPGSFAFAQAGAGLGAIFDAGDSFSLEGVFNLQLKLALAALSVVIVLSLFLKRFIK